MRSLLFSTLVALALAGCESEERLIPFHTAAAPGDLGDDRVAIDSGLQIAVVEGHWDAVENLLTELGVRGTNLDSFANAGPLLGNFELLSRYDAVLINCGASESHFEIPDHAAAENLRAWVESGGRLYASDMAYDFVEDSFPEFIDFAGEDGDLDAAETGASATLEANLVSTRWVDTLGKSTVSVDYPFMGWAVMESVSDAVELFIEGADGVPHAVGFDAGEGRVVFTSFHLESDSSEDTELLLRSLIFEM